MAVKVIGQYTLVIASSLLVGAAIFVPSFVVMDFVWTHFVVTDLQKLSIGDGVVVVGGGFVFGLVFGLAGLGSCALSILAASNRKITNIL
jgi:hypothetical protein